MKYEGRGNQIDQNQEILFNQKKKLVHLVEEISLNMFCPVLEGTKEMY